MNQDKFTIQLDAKAENFAAVAASVRELGTALKGAAPDLDALKRTLESLSGLSQVVTTLAETTKSAGKLTDEFVRMDRAARDVRRGVVDLDEDLNGARITAGSLADAMGRLRTGSVRLENALESSSDAVSDTTSSLSAASAEMDDLARAADRAEEQLDQLGEQAKRTDAETRNVGDAGVSGAGGLQMAAVAGGAAAGAMAALAVAMEKRHPLLPEVPTFKELGVDWVDGAFRGIGVPKSTPIEARRRLAELWASLNAESEMKELAAKSGFELVNIGPDQMDGFMRDRIRTYAEVGKQMGLGNK